jgi:SAM-dependent methyltransferase
MPDFAVRSRTAELMETAECGYESYRDCLRDLAQVNVVTLGARPTLAFLERLRCQGRLPDHRLHVADIGSGYGDGLAKVARWARSKGVRVRLTGVDSHPWSIRAAREAHPYLGVEWICSDVYDYDDVPDVVVSSLFTHHLDDLSVRRFLAWMEARATHGWFINDLHRHPLPYWGFAALAQAVRWHPFVRHDGPVSIARAFRPADWTDAFAAAGLAADAARIERWFPFRLCVARIKADAP